MSGEQNELGSVYYYVPWEENAFLFADSGAAEVRSSSFAVGDWSAFPFHLFVPGPLSSGLPGPGPIWGLGGASFSC